MTSNISDDADFLLSLVPFLDAHHVRTDRIEAIADQLRVMPTEEMIEAAKALSACLRRIEARTAALNQAVGGSGQRGLEPPIWSRELEALDVAMQSTLLKEGDSVRT